MEAVLERTGNEAVTSLGGTSRTVFAPGAKTVRMGVADEALVLSMLSNISANSGVYVLREMWSNAVDAQRRAGVLDAEHPIEVDVSSDSSGVEMQDLVTRMLAKGPNDGALSTLRVTDHGCGMTKDELASNFLQYGGSDKRDDQDAIGSKGLGSKAPLAIADGFTVTTTKDSITSTAVVARPAAGMPEATVSSAWTGQESGTTVEVTFVDPDGSIANSMHDYAEAMSRYLEDDILELDGTMMPSRLKRLVESGEWVKWEAADGITVYEAIDTSSCSSSALPTFGHRDIAFPDGSQPYARYGMDGCEVALFGERYRLPHFGECYHEPNCIACIEPGFLDFSPSRDEVMDNARTRAFESWLQARIYDHIRENDNEGERIRLTRDADLWRAHVFSVGREDGIWRVAMSRDAYRMTTRHPSSVVTFHYGTHDEFSEVLAAAESLSSNDMLACEVSLAYGEGARAKDVTRLDNNPWTTAVTRTELKSYHFENIRGSEHRQSTDAEQRLANVVCKLMAMRDSFHGLSMSSGGYEGPLLTVVPVAWLSDIVSISPEAFDGIAIEGGLEDAKALQASAPHVFRDPDEVRREIDAEVEQRRAKRREQSRRRRNQPAGNRKDKADRGMRDLMRICRASKYPSYAINEDLIGKPGVPVELVAFRQKSMPKPNAQSVMDGIVASVTCMFDVIDGDHDRCIVATWLPVDTLMRLADSDDVRLVATYGFADSTLECVKGMRRSVLAPVLSLDPTSVLHIDVEAAIGAFGMDTAKDLVMAAGAMRLEPWPFVTCVRSIVPDLQLPAWASKAVTLLAKDRMSHLCIGRGMVVIDDGNGRLKSFDDDVARVNRRWVMLSENAILLRQPSTYSINPDHPIDADPATIALMAPVMRATVDVLFDVNQDSDRKDTDVTDD